MTPLPAGSESSPPAADEPPLKTTIGQARRGLGSVLPGPAYVGRPSPLGNPFVLGRDGNREEVIAEYRHWLWAQMQWSP